MNWMHVLAQQGAGGALSGHWTWIDWGVVLGYLVFTTVLGGLLAGKQATIRDFFLGGRKLPWYAVTGSIIATEISALTFISVPFVVFKDGGNFNYLQLGVFGSLFSRIIVAWVLVPAYYRREIYSPYDYMGNQLGSRVRSMTTALFTLSGLLAQSARVYLTAVVLQLILRDQLQTFQDWTGIDPITTSIFIIGIVAILWTIMGGITTVIWTDVILFFIFFLGAAIALFTVCYYLPGSVGEGFGELVRIGREARKFDFFNFKFDWTNDLTIWTAVIASTWGGIGAYGTDQLMAQRMFCCRNARDAKKALIASWVGQAITFTVALVGVGLYAYYQHFPLQGEALAAYREKGDRIFPIFILSVIPTGLTGLIIAGVFAAAISSLDSILAALSQTTISAFYLPWRERVLGRRTGVRVVERGDALTAPENPKGPPGDTGAGVDAAAVNPSEDRLTVLVSRISVVFWGLALCVVAKLAEVAAERFGSILQLGLSMAGYVGGALLAGFLLGFLPLRINGRGYMWSAPLSVLTVFSLAWHEPWAHWVCWIGGALLALTWIVSVSQRRAADELPRNIAKTLLLLAGISMMIVLTYYGYFEGPVDPNTDAPSKLSIAWPWWSPIGSSVAFLWGWALADRKDAGT